MLDVANFDGLTIIHLNSLPTMPCQSKIWCVVRKWKLFLTLLAIVIILVFSLGKTEFDGTGTPQVHYVPHRNISDNLHGSKYKTSVPSGALVIHSTETDHKARQNALDNAIKIHHNSKFLNNITTECEILTSDMVCVVSNKFSEKEQYDSVLVHMREIRLTNSEKWWNFSRRKPSQTVIFYENEPPTKTWSRIKPEYPANMRRQFNVTSTFTPDSDIPFEDWRCYRNHQRHQQLAGTDYNSNKTRNVAWFVSHCETPNKREVYVRELSKYIDVDIYGACGSLECGHIYAGADIKTECEKEVLDKTYKFYLAFENSFCENYITEKIKKLFENDINIIPVVMGYTNYSARLPSDAFIDVRDFASPKDLANHLIRISENDDLFNEYIRNKKSLDCEGDLYDKYCRICRYLHEHRHQQKIVEDVADFWSVERKCISNQKYWEGKMP